MLLSSSRLPGSARRATPCARAPRSVSRIVCHAHGHGHGGGHPHGGQPVSTVLTEKDKGFIAEMRKVAMKLHTKDQAPKEGGMPAPKPQQFLPTRPGYLRFLTESKAVYDTFDRLIAADPQYAMLRNTGLERSQALAADEAWFEKTYGLHPPKLSEDGPGLTYCRLLEKLAKEDPPAFICHYYNFYFAHTAGGRMIGNKVAGMILDGHTLEFYQWKGDVNELLENVRRTINEMAEGWSREAKDHCLEETADTFKYSGVILQCITQQS